MLKIKNVKKAEECGDYTLTETREPTPVYSVSFEYLGGKDVMPIGGWWGPYKATNPICDLREKRFYEMIKNCGVNHITVSKDDYASDKESAVQGMNFAEECGLGIFVHDTVLPKLSKAEEMGERINEYRFRKNVLGFHVFDEPYPNHFEWIETHYKNFAKLDIEEQPLYTNLLPVYGTTIFDKFNIDYEKYLEEFLRRVPTKFLSYDYYPFYFKGEGTGGAKKYFSNLSSIRAAAKRYKIPFWVFLQAGGQWQCIGKASIENYPTREEMFWNMHTNMAYGAKAFQYFTLLQPEDFAETDNGLDCRRIGLIGFDGEKNEWYPIAKEINAYIAFIDEVMMNAENLGVIPVGKWSNSLVEGTEKLFSFRELVEAVGSEAIIGCFDYQGKTALYLVNNSTTEQGTMSLRFDCNRKFVVYTNGKTAEFCGECPIFEMNAGEGVLIVLK